VYLCLAELQMKRVVEELLLIQGFLCHQAVSACNRGMRSVVESCHKLGRSEYRSLCSLAKERAGHRKAACVANLDVILLRNVPVLLHRLVVNEPLLIAQHRTRLNTRTREGSIHSQ